MPKFIGNHITTVIQDEKIGYCECFKTLPTNHQAVTYMLDFSRFIDSTVNTTNGVNISFDFYIPVDAADAAEGTQVNRVEILLGEFTGVQYENIRRDNNMVGSLYAQTTTPEDLGTTKVYIGLVSGAGNSYLFVGENPYRNNGEGHTSLLPNSSNMFSRWLHITILGAGVQDENSLLQVAELSEDGLTMLTSTRSYSIGKFSKMIITGKSTNGNVNEMCRIANINIW